MSKAAKKLGIARNTAMNWESDLKERIESLKAIRIEELKEKYRISKEMRIVLFGERYLALTKGSRKGTCLRYPRPSSSRL